jgi:hypothetical protein
MASYMGARERNNGAYPSDEHDPGMSRARPSLVTFFALTAARTFLTEFTNLAKPVILGPATHGEMPFQAESDT